MIFKYKHEKNEKLVTYYLKLNQTLGENISVKAYYYDAGTLVPVDMIKTGRSGIYFCDFYKEIGEYYIEIQSEKYKNLEFDLYVPANIASVSINNYKISDYINNLRLGIGEDYSFDVICNDTATYGTKMTVKLYSSYVINVTYDSIEKTIMIPNDKRLFGAILELSFETLDGNDYRMYQFEIVSPYTVEAKITNDQVKVTFKDVFEKTVSSDDIYSDITYYYYLNGTRYSIEAAGTQCDLIDIPHFEQSILINVVVDYKNSQLDNYTTDLSYSVNNVYGLSQTLSSSGVNKWVINAQNDKTTVSNTLTVPSKIKAVNILGKAGTTYSDYKISVQSRTVPLTINLNNFNFSASNSYAIYASGTCEVIINVYDSCTIATTAEGYDCIRVYNLTISKGTLKVKGSNRKTTSATVSAGKGINVDNLLTVDNCNLTVTGGNGVVSSSTRNGYAGVNGGTAVSAKSVLVKSSTLTFTGGNGSNGHNGSAGGAGSSGSTSSVSGKPGSNGGNGGKGGNGGLALNINTLQTWSNSRATLIGGTGGNGGNGATLGGKGGDGGNGGDGHNDTSVSGGCDHGGNGGNGGKGGYSQATGLYANPGNGGDGGDGGDPGSNGKGFNGGKGGNGYIGGDGGDGSDGGGLIADGGDGGDGGHGCIGGGSGGKGGAAGDKATIGSNGTPGDPG